MKGLWIALGGLAVVVVLLGGMIASSYNGLVRLDEEVDTRWGQVENMLQRRNDLVPNLVSTVQGIAEQEQQVFGDIAEARARMAGARNPEQTMQAARAMDSALGRLFVVVENYPQLRSSENFLRLQDELAGTENRIAQERRRYNESVRDINVRVRSFPTNLIAGMLGFEQRELFEAAEGAEAVPEVQFDLRDEG